MRRPHPGATVRYEMGLLNAVVPREQLLDKAYEYARRITANAPLAVQATKQSVWEGLGMSLRDAYKNESALSSMIFQTEDAKEGPKAFAREAQAELAGEVADAAPSTHARRASSASGSSTWHPDEVGDEGAPEPLAMWEDVARVAADDTGVGARPCSTASTACRSCTARPGSTTTRRRRLAARLGVEPRRTLLLGHRRDDAAGAGERSRPSGSSPASSTSRWSAGRRRSRPSGGTSAAVSATPTASSRRSGGRSRGRRRSIPAEVAHEVFQAWLTFAIFDNARRGHLGVGLDEYRRQLGELLAPFTDIAAANPLAWFPVARSADEIITATPENRMVGYPYTKYMVSIMDVDMAAAVLVASHEAADALGVPPERRVYLRGWCYATDPVYVAEHDEMWRSPAMAAAAREALRVGGVGVDDVAHLDLYSCFGSSVNFARDALGAGRRRFAIADGHRRAAVPRRRRQRLHDALDRDDGRRPARATPARTGSSAGWACT